MQLIRQRVQRLKGDDGFTLVELVISVAILGVVSAALLGVVLQYLKTTSDTQARLTESTDQQFVSTYWQNDVSSLGRRALNAASGTLTPAQSVFVDAAAPGGCGASVGSVVVAFAWNDFETDASAPADAWTSKPREVAYVTVSRASRLVLQRVRCRGGVEGAPVTVAHNLTEKPTISCNTSCVSATPLPNRVSMTFTVKDADHPNSPGYTTTVSADRRQG